MLAILVLKICNLRYSHLSVFFLVLAVLAISQGALHTSRNLFPSVQAQGVQEESITVPPAQKPIGPSDLQNGNWLKPEYWNGSSEIPFASYTPTKQAYFRYEWGSSKNQQWLAWLIDDVTDKNEGISGVSFLFDTNNMRYQVRDPTLPGTSGVYAAFYYFNPPGRQLVNVYDQPYPGNPFPYGTLYVTWAFAPSPIPNGDQSRLIKHNLYGLLISKELLTQKNMNFGTRIHLYESDSTLYLGIPDAEYGYAKMSFGTAVDESPLPQILLAVSVATALGILSESKTKKDSVIPHNFRSNHWRFRE